METDALERMGQTVDPRAIVQTSFSRLASRLGLFIMAKQPLYQMTVFLEFISLDLLISFRPSAESSARTNPDPLFSERVFT
jgi:hypothetical protein